MLTPNGQAYLPADRAAIAAARRFRKNGATPKWADKELIRDMYIEAKYQQLHVDHIVPLKSPFVCGLHVEANLQLCDPVVNIKKKNKFWPDMWVNQ